MPSIEIKFENIVFDPLVQTYCNNPNYICPHFGHSWSCPPEAPYLEEIVSKFESFFLVYFELDLNEYVKKIKAKHPKRKENRIRSAVYHDNFVRDSLEKEILQFVEDYKGDYNERIILWDGFCRICYNKEERRCTYDSGKPCRYPDRKRHSMEAVGINVNQTVGNLDIKLEWPPNNHVYRFGLVCFK
jgi:predicted metal-binding protein